MKLMICADFQMAWEEKPKAFTHPHLGLFKSSNEKVEALFTRYFFPDFSPFSAPVPVLAPALFS